MPALCSEQRNKGRGRCGYAASHGEFFKPPPPIKLAEDPPREEWTGPPKGVFAGVVPIERIVARSEEVVIYLSGFFVFPAGFETQVRVVARDEESDLDPFDYEHRESAEESSEMPPGQLRIGFEFADGSKVTTTGADFAWEWPAGREQPTSPKMSSVGGRGGREREGGSWGEGFWVWPLPPKGELSLVCEWPAAGISLTRFALDASTILEAAPRAQELFDD